MCFIVFGVHSSLRLKLVVRPATSKVNQIGMNGPCVVTSVPVGVQKPWNPIRGFLFAFVLV